MTDRITRITLARSWADFERRVLDPMNASQIQRTEMRRAWYAGASDMLAALTNAMEPGTEPTENDLAYVSALNRELVEFGEKLKSGLA